MENESIVFHVDRVATSFGNILIQGWAVDREGKRLHLCGEHGKSSPGDLHGAVGSGGRQRDLSDGDRLSGRLSCGGGYGKYHHQKARLVFENGSGKKSFEIDLHKNRLRNSFRRRFLHDDTIPMDYDEWIRRQGPRGKAWLDQRRESFAWEPLFSVVIPLYNTPIPFLKRIIDSVLYQTYRKVELCLADGRLQ